MHPNPAFRTETTTINLRFAQDRGFGMLTLAGADGPLASHIPFVMNEAGDRLAAHIVRSNPIWQHLRGGEATALLAVTGPDGYVSPDWYGDPAFVPTWNYVAVHLRGPVRLLSDDALRPHLAELSAEFETRLAPKRPWTLDKIDDDALARLLRMIAPIEMDIQRVEGTWKLGQNKTSAAQAGAADGVATSAIGQELAALSALMRGAID